jgi:hypothetical protein
MRSLGALTLAASVTLAAPLPVLAQEAAPEEGFSLMEEGAKQLFRGMMAELEPALDDLQGLAEEMEPTLRAFVDEMGPAMIQLMEQIDDLTNYHAPEILPNGDIIIRRKDEAPELELDGIDI